MFSALTTADRELFLLLNGMHSPFWDFVMSTISAKLTWIPLYALLLAGLIYHYRVKVVPVIMAVVLCITLADQISSSILKPLVERPRPCHSPFIGMDVHTVDGCGGMYGFVSSHAANTFGLAVLLWLLFRRRYPAVAWLFVWAMVVGYSRIYLGVHYPLDILGGYIVGAASAITCYKLYLSFGGRLRWLKEDDLRLKARGWA